MHLCLRCYVVFCNEENVRLSDRMRQRDMADLPLTNNFLGVHLNGLKQFTLIYKKIIHTRVTFIGVVNRC